MLKRRFGQTLEQFAAGLMVTKIKKEKCFVTHLLCVANQEEEIIS